MPTNSLEETIESVEADIKAIGYSETQVKDLTPPRDQIPDDSEQTPQTYIIEVESSAGPSFTVIGEAEDQYFSVQSNYQLWLDIARQFDPEEAEKFVELEGEESIPDDHPLREVIPIDRIDLEDEERVAMLASFEVLTSIDQKTRQELIYQLTDIFTANEVKHRVDTTTDQDGITGFTVHDKIFPQEPDFSLYKVNRTVERVRMAAHRAEIFLRYAFNLGVDMERTRTGAIGENPDGVNRPRSGGIPGLEESPKPWK